MIIAVVVFVLSGGGYFWFMHQKVTEPVGIATNREPRREPIPRDRLVPSEATLIKLRTSEGGCSGDQESVNRLCDFRPEWGLDGSNEREMTVDYLDFGRGHLDADQYLDVELEDYLEVELATQLDEFDTVERYLDREAYAGVDPVFQAERYFGWVRGEDTQDFNGLDKDDPDQQPDPDKSLTELAGPWDEAYLYEWDMGTPYYRFAMVVFRKGTQVVKVEYSGSNKTYWLWQDEVRMPANEARDGAKAAALDIAAKL
ncbi:hypothetical protein ACWEV3_18705 [Saccharopolyspora sp. NPDC003752]